VTTWVLLALFAGGLVLSVVGVSPARAGSETPQGTLLQDNFAQDTNLNTQLWQINGPVGTAFGNFTCPSCALVPLNPGFSSEGMEIAQINESYEMGTIQSTQSFGPPFTVTAVVRGTVSNGHPFVFGIASTNSTAGVEITGNLDPRDCSNETNCDDSSTCGNSANPSIPPNQCYYGIYARAGTTGASWARSPNLNSSPSVGVDYSLQIAVNSAGEAQYTVSQGGLVLGSSTATVGTGPFYIMLAQSEGAPVPGPGPNQAYWFSLSVTPTAAVSTPSTSSSSSSWLLWTLVAIVAIIALILIVVLWNGRKRELIVQVNDLQTLLPLPGAGVSAVGPRELSGSTGSDGKVAFGGVTSGDYMVKVDANGYNPSPLARVTVQRRTQHSVNLSRATPSTPASLPSQSPSPGLTPTAGVPEAVVAGPVPPSAVPAATPTELTSPPVGPEPLEELEGWAGERIRQIIATFQARGATSPETAQTANELGLSRMFVRIMKRRRGKTRVFVEISGKYYLDEKALRGMK
jgi:hypothetical protein